MLNKKGQIIGNTDNVNPYAVICLDCDKTFQTDHAGFNHADKYNHDIYHCENGG